MSPRRIAAILGALLASLVLAGCGDRTGSSAKQALSAAPSAGASPLGGDSASPPVGSSPPGQPASSAAVADSSGALPAPRAPGADTGAATPPIRLAFVGDIALNYSVAKDIESLAAGESPGAASGTASPQRGPRAGVDAGFPFGGVRERLRAADIAMGNLECVASVKGMLDTWHKPFRAPVIGIDTVLAGGIDVVSVANNHSFDFGEEGFTDMLKNLDDKKLAVVGRGYRQKTRHQPERAFVREVRGTRVGFLGFYLAEDSDIARDVAAARKEADLVVVYFHWGREKQSDATPEQRRQARAAIDAGADVVVGSHVHVLQPTEVYKGKLIAYGLGNFVFMGMNHEERFRRGAILEVGITRDRLESFELVPTRVDDRGAPRIVVPESSYLPGKDKEDKDDKDKDAR